MAEPSRPTRIDLLKITNGDLRTAIAIEQLFDFIPSDFENLSDSIDEVNFTSGTALARAQQAIDAISALDFSKDYGSFFDTSDQAASSIDTAKEATFSNTQFSNGVTVSGSQITVEKTGLYKIECRIQL